MKEFGDKVPADMRKKVETAADALDAAIKSGNIADIKSKTDELNNAWTEASSAMYQQATAGSPGAGQQAGGGQAPSGGPSGGQAADGGRPAGDTAGKKVEDASFEVMDDKNK